MSTQQLLTTVAVLAGLFLGSGVGVLGWRAQNRRIEAEGEVGMAGAAETLVRTARDLFADQVRAFDQRLADLEDARSRDNAECEQRLTHLEQLVADLSDEVTRLGGDPAPFRRPYPGGFS